MRLSILFVVLSLAACHGYYSTQTAEIDSPVDNATASRNGFYDGGLFDPDMDIRPVRPVD